MDCIENTCAAVVTAGTRPDQIRVEPRLYAASPLRPRATAGVAADGRVDHSSCGMDVRIAGDDLDDAVVPTALGVPLTPTGDIAANGLSRRTLPTGEIALYVPPAINSADFTDTAIGSANGTGNIGATNTVIGVGGTTQLAHTAGAFRRLVRVRATVRKFKLGAMAWTIDSVEIAASPPVSYQLSYNWNVVVNSQIDRQDSDTELDVGMNGTTDLGSFILAPGETLNVGAAPQLRYTAPVPAVFGFQGGELELKFEVTELAGEDIT